MTQALLDSTLRQSEEYRLLSLRVQKWVGSKDWTRFTPVQSFAIRTLLTDPPSQPDLILCAPTAGGKTMAALLPLLSLVPEGEQSEGTGYEFLYVCPTRALVSQQSLPENDVVTLAQSLGLECNPWMGDVSEQKKQRSWAKPQGILIITPESLESRLLNTPFDIASRFRNLRAVVVDELHAYFEGPRGPQLISLLSRLEFAIGRRVQRVALSATLGNGSDEDWIRIHRFLRPSWTPGDRIVPREEDATPGGIEAGFEIIMRTFEDPDDTDDGEDARVEIAKQVRAVFENDDGRAGSGLVFTSSRREAERYTNLLNSLSQPVDLPANWGSKEAADEDDDLVEDELVATALPERAASPPRGAQGKAGVTATDSMDAPIQSAKPSSDPRRYWTHHGSLNRSYRAEAERRMRSKEVPCTLVATTTLELGIDVGRVREVVQIGPGYSVASLRQRLGRSGRLSAYGPAAPPRLHVFVREPNVSDDDHILNRLHLPTVQAVAQVCLLRQRNYESPDPGGLHLSTFVQQLVSLIHQFRETGLTRGEAFKILVEDGPFASTQDPLFDNAGEDPGPSIFDAVIERLRTRYPPLLDVDSIHSDPSRHELFLTAEGDRLARSHSIYAAFRTPDEYIVHASSGIIGTVGLGSTYGTGDRILLCGRAWQITAIDHQKRRIEVRATSRGAPAYFTGDALSPSDQVVGRMRFLYELEDEALLDDLLGTTGCEASAALAVRAGRAAFRGEGLIEKPWVSIGDDLFWFPWVGRRTLVGLCAALRNADITASVFRVALFMQDKTEEQVVECLADTYSGDNAYPSLVSLASRHGGASSGKFDWYLSPLLRRRDFASSQMGSPDEIWKQVDAVLHTAARSQ